MACARAAYLLEMFKSCLLAGDAQELLAREITMSGGLLAAERGRLTGRKQRSAGGPAGWPQRSVGGLAAISDRRENRSVLACVDHGEWPMTTGSNFKMFAVVGDCCGG